MSDDGIGDVGDVPAAVLEVVDENLAVGDVVVLVAPDLLVGGQVLDLEKVLGIGVQTRIEVVVVDLEPLVDVVTRLTLGGERVRVRAGSGVHFEPGVGQVFNGYFSTRGRLGRSALVDVAQVEVLKGPQGAIIGKNTSLGAINITPNKPTEDFEAYLGGQYNFEASEGYEVDAVVSGSFSDSVRGRAAINWRDVDGWVQNTSTGRDLQQQEDLTARLMLDVDFTDSFSGEFMYQRTDYDRHGKARMPAGCQDAEKRSNRYIP